MADESSSTYKLLVTDIDNTLFDWVDYYATAFSALLGKLSTSLGIDYEILAAESSAVFSKHQSIEYPFLVQELASVEKRYGRDVDLLLDEAVAPARQAFLAAAEPKLVPYEGVLSALLAIRRLEPKIPIVALTDAPRYVAMWKLNKLGLLDCFDAVYGLPDPKLPVDADMQRVKVEPEILLKHLSQVNFSYRGIIRTLPMDYEKPGNRGLKTVLMDYGLDEDKESRRSVLWVGDNVYKDVALGRSLGVATAWAQYGASVDPERLKALHQFSPLDNIKKHANVHRLEGEAPKPDFVLAGSFAELLPVLRR